MEKIIKKPPKEKIIRSRGEKICHELVFVVFLIYAFTLVYPFFYLLMNSLKDYEEIADFPMRLPTKILWESYLHAWFSLDIATMFYNTIILSVGETFVSMSLTCMAAYTLAKYPFKGNTVIYTVILVCSVVPTFGSEASTFQLMTRLNLRNKYVGMLIMCGGFGTAFLYLHSFFKGIPWSFAESAMLDGASEFRIFVQIMLPLAKNGIMVFTIMKFIGYWNDYWAVYLYYCNIGQGFEHHWTLAVGLAKLSQNRHIDTNVFYAGTVICIIPALIFYAIFSDKLMGNLNAGGIKG
jgi:ABC-type glycerol-3-phosphate transport system permease component